MARAGGRSRLGEAARGAPLARPRPSTAAGLLLSSQAGGHRMPGGGAAPTHPPAAAGSGNKTSPTAAQRPDPEGAAGPWAGRSGRAAKQRAQSLSPRLRSGGRAGAHWGLLGGQPPPDGLGRPRGREAGDCTPCPSLDSGSEPARQVGSLLRGSPPCVCRARKATAHPGPGGGGDPGGQRTGWVGSRAQPGVRSPAYLPPQAAGEQAGASCLAWPQRSVPAAGGARRCWRPQDPRSDSGSGQMSCCLSTARAAAQHSPL